MFASSFSPFFFSFAEPSSLSEATVLGKPAIPFLSAPVVKRYRLTYPSSRITTQLMDLLALLQILQISREAKSQDIKISLPTLTKQGESKQALLIAPMLELPNEILAHIVSFLDNGSALAFAGVCQRIRQTYPELALLGASQEIRYAYSATGKAAFFSLLPIKERLRADITYSLKFIHQKGIEKEEKNAMLNQYERILLRLFKSDETTSDVEFKIYAVLAEKLLQHVEKEAREKAFSKIFGFQNQALPETIRMAFVRFSHINLPLTLNLFVAYARRLYEKRLFPMAFFPLSKELETYNFLFNKLPNKDKAVQFINRFFLRYSDSALHFAIETGFEDIAEALLEISPHSIEIVDIKKCPLLISAVLKNKVGLVKNLLVRFKADIHAQDKEGRTALMHATIQENDEMCRLLQEHGANIADPL
jgi:hypothetical protein